MLKTQPELMQVDINTDVNGSVYIHLDDRYKQEKNLKASLYIFIQYWENSYIYNAFVYGALPEKAREDLLNKPQYTTIYCQVDRKYIDAIVNLYAAFENLSLCSVITCYS